MDHAADAQRINLMTITRFVLNERSKHSESRGDFTNLLSHIVTCCWELLLDSLYLLAKPTCRYFVSTNLRAKNKRNWMCFQMSFSSRPWSSVAEHASLSLKGIKRQILLSHRCVEDGGESTLDDVLQPGKNMVAAGYCMYGSSCMLLISTGNGVNGFTLDPSLGEFILTHPDIEIPKKGKRKNLLSK